jgi:DNA-directed RNA polymerase specialized sigma24 family protein
MNTPKADLLPRLVDGALKELEDAADEQLLAEAREDGEDLDAMAAEFQASLAQDLESWRSEVSSTRGAATVMAGHAKAQKARPRAAARSQETATGMYPVENVRVARRTGDRRLPEEAHLRELFRRIARGGAQAAEAMDELCRTGFKPLSGFFCTMGIDRAEAQDLVQEVFLRVLRTPGLAEIQIARGWLFLVARRVAIDGFRRRGPVSYDAGEAASQEPPAGTQDAGAWRDADIDVRRALEILRDRNPDWYLALQCAAAGLSGKELAVALQRGREGTANQLLCEARGALREIYAKLTGDGKPRNGRSLPA